MSAAVRVISLAQGTKPEGANACLVAFVSIPSRLCRFAHPVIRFQSAMQIGTAVSRLTYSEHRRGRFAGLP